MCFLYMRLYKGPINIDPYVFCLNKMNMAVSLIHLPYIHWSIILWPLSDLTDLNAFYFMFMPLHTWAYLDLQCFNSCQIVTVIRHFLGFVITFMTLWSWPLTFKTQNQIYSSLHALKYFLQIWLELPQCFSIYHVNKVFWVFCWYFNTFITIY